MGKAERLQIWAARQLDRRGPTLLIVARFIPGGRTASTFMAGRTAYPLRAVHARRSSSPASLWAAFATMLGYIGGQAFHDQTLLATGLGMLLALGFAGLVELVMSRRRAPSRRAWRDGRRGPTPTTSRPDPRLAAAAARRRDAPRDGAP